MAFYSNWSATKKRNVLIAALYVAFVVFFGFIGIPAKHAVGFIGGVLMLPIFAVLVWFAWVKILGKSF